MMYKSMRSNSISTGNVRLGVSFTIVVILIAVLYDFPVRGQGDKWQKLMAAGNSQAEKGQSSEAEKTYREALVIAEKSDSKHLRLPATLMRLASVCEAQAKHDDAYSLTNRALMILNKATNSYKTLKLDKPSQDEYYKIEITKIILDNAVSIYVAQKKYSEAEPLLMSIVTIHEGVARHKPAKGNAGFVEAFNQLTRRPAHKLIKAYENLSTFYFNQGRHAEAEAIYKRAFEYFAENSEATGTGRTSEASIYNKLGELYFKESKFVEAESSFGDALKIYQTGGYKHGTEIGVALSNMATLYVKQEKKYDHAQSYFQQALRILEEDTGTDKLEIADTLENYAILLRKLGNENEAVEMGNRAKVIRGQRTQPIQNQ